MHKSTAKWQDREDYIFTIEKATSTLNIIADACGNGAYTGTERVEEALNLVADNISHATKELRLALWPAQETDAEGRTTANLEYRHRFEAWLEACDANSADVCSAGDALREAIDALRLRPARSWNDVAELGIVAHDHAWNRFSQNYVPRDCPDDILTALILGVIQFGGIKAIHHQPPAGWKSPLKISS